MAKWVKTVIGVALLPICIGVARALWSVLAKAGPSDHVWVPMFAGAAAWWAIFLLMPKPMLIYVYGHELTHAVWTWACGGRVKRFKATSKGGAVVVTKNNFLITLAPYFFPLYAVLIVVIFVLGRLMWNWDRYRVWFHLLVGAAYAFHITLTWHILKTRQSDISDQGCLFSAVIIFLGNAVVLLLAMPLLTGSGHLLAALGQACSETGVVLRRISGIL